MKLKSYRSDSVEAAIRLAKVELGEEAIFMGSRENGPSDESSARYEVIFAVAAGQARPPGGKAVAPHANGSQAGGTHHFSRPGWVGLARRAFGTPRAAPSGESPPQPDAVAAGASVSAASQPHWRDFLPPEAAAPRRGDPAAAAPAAALETASAEHPRAARSGLAPWECQPRPASGLSSAAGQSSLEAGPRRDLLPEKQPEPLAAGRGEPNNGEDVARAGAVELLVSQGMCAAAARGLVREALGECCEPSPAGSLPRRLESSIARGCRVDPTLGRAASPSEPAIAVFVGPAGAGKTSTICKLALSFGVAAQRPVHFVSVDPFRLGAMEQLESFADLLNAPFSAVEDYAGTQAAVRRAIARAGLSMPPLVLIDTPGFGPAEWSQAKALAATLAGLPGLDTHMVVAATSSAGHLRHSLRAFEIFRPRKLLITKLDECAEAGAIVGETLRLRLPISYFSTGQRIPEDIAPATPERLAQQLLQAF